MKQILALTIRLILSPFILLALLCGAIAHAIVWTFDPTYDRAAAMDTFAGILTDRSKQKTVEAN